MIFQEYSEEHLVTAVSQCFSSNFLSCMHARLMASLWSFLVTSNPGRSYRHAVKISSTPVL
jgi:hypothetical protein